MDVQQVRAAAVKRTQARLRPPEYRVAGRNPDGTEVKMQVAGGDGEVLAPVTVGEWLDDRVVRVPAHLGPWVRVLYEIAEAARLGERAAVSAVVHARGLSAHDQFRLGEALLGWQNSAQRLPAAAPLLHAVLAEWRRLGLQAAKPEEALV